MRPFLPWLSSYPRLLGVTAAVLGSFYRFGSALFAGRGGLLLPVARVASFAIAYALLHFTGFARKTSIVSFCVALALAWLLIYFQLVGLALLFGALSV